MPKDAKPSTITISRDPAGRYFVSFLVEEDIQPLPVSPKTVGVDLGLHTRVTLSTGEKTGNERSFAKDEKRLARLQRRHAKKQKRSKNREKARRKVAKVHARMADRRRDFQQKLTTRIIRENQVVCIESLAVKNMLQNHHLAKSIADVGWGEIIRQLQYKARWYGRTVVAIDRFYPSSKQCHACGHILDSLDLDERSWTCPNCGVVHDRDTNAALTIKAAGLAVLACGERVRPNLHGSEGRHASAKQEIYPARGGIPLPLGRREDVNCNSSAEMIYFFFEKSFKSSPVRLARSSNSACCLHAAPAAAYNTISPLAFYPSNDGHEGLFYGYCWARARTPKNVPSILTMQRSLAV